MAKKIKRPRMAILAEFDGTQFVGSTYRRNGYTVVGVETADGSPHFDIIAFLNGYGTRSGSDLSSKLTDSIPAQLSNLTSLVGGIDENNLFYLEADAPFTFSIDEDNKELFGFTGDEATVQSSGNYRITATNRWQRGVFQIDKSNNRLGLGLADTSAIISYSVRIYDLYNLYITLQFQKSQMSATTFAGLDVGGTISTEATSHSASYTNSIDRPTIKYDYIYSSFADHFTSIDPDVTIFEDESGNEYLVRHKWYNHDETAFYFNVERINHSASPADNEDYTWTFPDHQGGTVTESITYNTSFLPTRQLDFSTTSMTQDDYDRLGLNTVATDANGNEQIILYKFQGASTNSVIAEPVGTFTPNANLSWSSRTLDFGIMQTYDDTDHYYVLAVKNGHSFTPASTDTYTHTNSNSQTFSSLQPLSQIKTNILNITYSNYITSDEWDSLFPGEEITSGNYDFELLHKYQISSYRYLAVKPTGLHKSLRGVHKSQGISMRFTTTELSSAAYASIVVDSTVLKDYYYYWRVRYKEEIVFDSQTYRQVYLEQINHTVSYPYLDLSWTANGTTYQVSYGSGAYDDSIEIEITDILAADLFNLDTANYVGSISGLSSTDRGGDYLNYDNSTISTPAGGNYEAVLYFKYTRNNKDYLVISRTGSQTYQYPNPYQLGGQLGSEFEMFWDYDLSSSADNFFWSAANINTLNWDALSDIRRVQNLTTFLRVRGSVNDADDIYSGKCLEDWEHTTGNTDLTMVLESDGKVSVNYPSSRSYDNVDDNNALGKKLLLRLGFDGTETESDNGLYYKQLKANNPAPCVLTSRGYVEMRRETAGRDEYAVMADGTVFSAGLTPLKGWNIVLRVAGPAFGYLYSRERTLQEWWSYARRGLTIYPTFDDPENNGLGGAETRRHIDKFKTYGTSEHHNLSQTVEADEEGNHHSKRVGGRILVVRHPGDQHQRRESYSGDTDMFQDVRIKVLDDPSR